MSDWLSQLRVLPVSRIMVHHVPRTARYDKAASKLPYLLRSSYLLGGRGSDSSPDISIEIALWAPPPSGRGPGYYSCFRLFHRQGVVSLAQLFAFYDGSEKSVGLKSLASAEAFSQKNGFGDEA